MEKALIFDIMPNFLDMVVACLPFPLTLTLFLRGEGTMILLPVLFQQRERE